MRLSPALSASNAAAAAAPGKRAAACGHPGRRRPHAVAAAAKGTERARRRGAVRAALAENGVGWVALEAAGTGGGGGGGCNNRYPSLPPEALDEWMSFSVKEVSVVTMFFFFLFSAGSVVV